MADRTGGPAQPRIRAADEVLSFDPGEPLPRPWRDLVTGPDRLSAREAARRLAPTGRTRYGARRRLPSHGS
ncbi:hypothetical protein ACF06M_00495 [Streptomyces sp. NPDC015238]|uniref:hypothetical protein n=1 Tax=Streptomyces sp. NPDC015238 TaxID=3364950 RepID=UPI0036FE4AC0